MLTVRHLRKVFEPKRRGGLRIVANDDLSLEVRAGEIVALLGPNGAGKSTFLKQLSGQLLPTSGEIEIGGTDMVAHPRAAKRFLSAVPQESQPLDNVTVEEHVRYFGLIKGLHRPTAGREVEAILRRVGLWEERTKLARELSGGFKRRVLIAIALAGADARLLLLDEPTTGLDPEARRAVWAVIDRLRADGKGVLLTTHYIEEAEYLADRVVLIAGGRFVLEGTLDAVRRRLPYGGRLEIRDPHRLSEAQQRVVAPLRARWRTSLDRTHLLRLEVPDPFAPATVDELGRLAAAGVAASLAPVSLEDVYLSAVGRSEDES